MSKWKTFECPNCGNVVEIENSRKWECYDCPECETTLMPQETSKWKMYFRKK